MKISPMPNIVPSADPQGNMQPSRVDSIRTMRLNTNATPLPNQLPYAANNTAPEATVEATQPLSPQLALLAKQRRAIQVREKELANREKAIKEQSQTTSSVDLARLKSEPLSVLLENGVTYDQLTEAIMANQGNSEINSLKAKIESLEKGIEQKFLDNASQSEKQVLAEMRKEANQLASGEEYELVRETHSVPHVMTLIERTYRETGEVLAVPEAMKLVEEELLKDAQKLIKLKKMQAQMQGQMAPQFQPQQRQTGMRTLTNRDTASVPLSARARAMAAFYGTLQKR